MAKTRYYGIKFPTQIKSKKTMLDLNSTSADRVKSELIHLIFTPEGQKLRDPLFGTNLVKFLMDPNDDMMWDDVVMHIKDKVKAFIPNCEIVDVSTEQFNEGLGLAVNLKYSVKEEDGEVRYYELQQAL